MGLDVTIKHWEIWRVCCFFHYLSLLGGNLSNCNTEFWDCVLLRHGTSGWRAGSADGSTGKNLTGEVLQDFSRSRRPF